MSSPSPESSSSPECPPPQAEWLEADGTGGFASGTVSGQRSRRYHALLLVATTPPTGRMVLVDGLEAWVETEAGTFALSSQVYAGDGGDVVHPDGASRIASFAAEPWPTWRYRVPALPDGSGECVLVHEVFSSSGATVLRWRVEQGGGAVRLFVRPLMSGRDYHSLHHENPGFGFEPEDAAPGCRRWWLYPDVPSVCIATTAAYTHDPQWYRRFVMTAERERGLDFVHDLASPGVYRFDLVDGQGGDMVLSCDAPAGADAASLARRELSRRAAFADPLDRAADAYFVRRGDGRSLVAGYPWFTDWGRDSFIALRGLALAGGRLADARSILLEWAGAVRDGMLPNRFPDRGEEPEYNSVDASLWFVVAACEYMQLARRGADDASPEGVEADAERLRTAIAAILGGYAHGTRYGIRADADALLRCGEDGVQLTWMDAKVGDWVVTPRIGKPVEVQALWLNALAAASPFVASAGPLFRRGLVSFRSKFWNPAKLCLYDVVDCDHVPGRVDDSVRPNQVFAAGGLPRMLLGLSRARAVVDTVERELWTPLGLRSLAPSDPAYRPRYRGGVLERDGAYHQGTAWPWLAGPFVEAWVRVRGSTPRVREQARDRFVAPLRRQLATAGLGHVSEVADGDAPHDAGGCPFQAWSVGELIRLERSVLAGPAAAGHAARAASPDAKAACRPAKAAGHPAKAA